jgi:chromosome segregation ATPase
MTPSEMEQEIKNLNVWVEEVRQNLQLVATKQDVDAATDRLRNELLSKLATKEFVLNLIKATRGEIRQVDQKVRQVDEKVRQVDHKVTSLAADVQKIAEQVAIVSTQLTGVSKQVAALGPGVRKK